MRLLSFLVLFFLVASALAQTEPGIQDNSFLVEEAYNQEFGVVQHISSFSYLADSKDWVYSFTQEWPAPGIRHQFSYTLTALRPGSFSSQGPGFGDVVFNYRYQLLGTGDTRVAMAPRFSLIFPTGDSNRARATPDTRPTFPSASSSIAGSSRTGTPAQPSSRTPATLLPTAPPSFPTTSDKV